MVSLDSLRSLRGVLWCELDLLGWHARRSLVGHCCSEGVNGRHHLERWSELEQSGLQINWSKEKFDVTSGIGGAVQPIGVAHVPAVLVGCNGVVPFLVDKQDTPPLMPVGLTRTLRARLDLDQDGDKVEFRRFGRESDLRNLECGHTVIRADQFATGGWHPPPGIISRHEKVPLKIHTIKAGRLRTDRSTNHRMNTDNPKDRHQLPRTIAHRHHVHTTVANQLRQFVLRQHRAKLRGRRMSLHGLSVRATLATRIGDATGRGGPGNIRQWARLTRSVMFVGMATFHDTLTMELLARIPTGDLEETNATMRKQEHGEKRLTIVNLPAT